jgi:hypothetical protein
VARLTVGTTSSSPPWKIQMGVPAMPLAAAANGSFSRATTLTFSGSRVGPVMPPHTGTSAAKRLG